MRAWPIALRFLRWLAVTIWFGIWFLGPGYLVLNGLVSDPRNPFPDWISLGGCAMLALWWLYISIRFAVTDELPGVFDT